MTTLLKQSTAKTVVLGPFVDSTDGDTEETALTIAQADIRLSKNAGAFAQTNNTAGATHMEKGHYSVPLDTTDTNTLGLLRLNVHVAGALACSRDFMVVPANVYDSLVGGSDKLDVNAAEWAGSATASTDVALATAPTNFADLAIEATTGRVKLQSSVAKNVETTVRFLMKDSTNHAPATGLTVSVSVSTDGGAFAAATNAVTEEGNGWYAITLTASEMNGDEVNLHCTATGADDTEVSIRTDP